MDYEDLLLEKQGGIATIILNVPEKLNAITSKMRRSLILASEEISQDDDIRAVVVTGAGRGFCSGADLTIETAEPSRYDRLDVFGKNWGTEAFFRIDKPVTGAINGPCAGAGFSWTLSMDIRIASEDAVFTTVYVLRGRVPDCGMSYWLPRIVGTAKALELIWTGEKLSAREALVLGIVNQVMPPDLLMSKAYELAAKIARQPPIAVELSKRIIYRSTADEINRIIDLETWAQRICNQSEDCQEAIRAFLKKEPPAKWKGK